MPAPPFAGSQPSNDHTKPSTPGTPVVTAVAANETATITVTASSDNVGVAGYAAFLDGSPKEAGRSATTTIQLSGVPAGQHSVVVRAFDAAGNYSDATEAVGFEMPQLVLGNESKIRVFRGMAEFEASGGAAANPGPVWIGGDLYHNQYGLLTKKTGANKNYVNESILRPEYRFDNHTEVAGGGTGVSVSTNSSVEYENHSTVQIVTGAGSYGQFDLTIAPTTFEGRAALIVHVPNFATCNNVLLYVATADFSQYFQANFALAASGSENPLGGWRVLYVDPTVAGTEGMTWTTYGNPEWGVTQFEKIRVRVVPASGQQTTVQVAKAVFDSKAKTQVSIVFDDAWLTTKTLAEPICAALGIPLATAAIVNYVGQSGYMTIDDLLEFQANGNAVLNHAVNNIGALDVGVTTESYTADIAACKSFLESHGLGRYADHYIFPKGQTTFAINEWLIANGYKSARTTNKGMFSSANGVLNERFNVQAWGLDSAHTYDQIVSLIKIAINSGRHVVLMGHLLGDTIASTQWKTSDFKKLMGLLAAWRDAGVIGMPLYPAFIDRLT